MRQPGLLVKVTEKNFCVRESCPICEARRWVRSVGLVDIVELDFAYEAGGSRHVEAHRITVWASCRDVFGQYPYGFTQVWVLFDRYHRCLGAYLIDWECYPLPRTTDCVVRYVKPLAESPEAIQALLRKVFGLCTPDEPVKLWLAEVLSQAAYPSGMGLIERTLRAMGYRVPDME